MAGILSFEGELLELETLDDMESPKLIFPDDAPLDPEPPWLLGLSTLPGLFESTEPPGLSESSGLSGLSISSDLPSTLTIQ